MHLHTISCSCDPRKWAVPPLLLHVDLSKMIPTRKAIFRLHKNEDISHEVSLPSPSDDPGASDHLIPGPGARGPQQHTLGSAIGIRTDPLAIRRNESHEAPDEWFVGVREGYLQTMRTFGHLRYSIGSESLKYTYLSFARNAMTQRRARDKGVEEHIRD